MVWSRYSLHQNWPHTAQSHWNGMESTARESSLQNVKGMLMYRKVKVHEQTLYLFLSQRKGTKCTSQLTTVQFEWKVDADVRFQPWIVSLSGLKKEWHWIDISLSSQDFFARLCSSHIGAPNGAVGAHRGDVYEVPLRAVERDDVIEHLLVAHIFQSLIRDPLVRFEPSALSITLWGKAASQY
jgi:hypothetical protein